MITTLDEGGEVRDFVTSGLAPEERRAMVGRPDGPRVFEHLRNLPGPLRVADLPGYLRSLGCSPSPWGSKTLQGTPMRHRGKRFGGFFLADWSAPHRNRPERLSRAIFPPGTHGDNRPRTHLGKEDPGDGHHHDHRGSGSG